MITIFTPTYNRGYCIKKLYESLKVQTLKSFEWIVINDGSSDNTDELFNEWMSENNEFPIIYRKVQNGGKHRAINNAVNMASTDAFFIVDSDDYLLRNAIEKAENWFDQVYNDESFAGVSGLRGKNQEKPIGGFGKFDGEFVDCTNIQRNTYNLLGDKAEIFKTNVLKKYPFPEFENENFIPEAVVWDKIAKDGYKIRWFNEIIYITEYLEDGLTAASNIKCMENPRGFLEYLRILETIYDKKEVDIIRLKYYNDLIRTFGVDKGIEVIQLANQLLRYI